MDSSPPQVVFLLWHVKELPDGDEDSKLIGVYATVEDADAARNRVLPQPGFRDFPDGFQVSQYTVGKDNWAEGFITWAEALQEFNETDTE